MIDNKVPTQAEITEAMEVLGKPKWWIEFAKSDLILDHAATTLTDIVTQGPMVGATANIAASFTAGFLTGYNRALKELQCQKTTN